MTAPPQRHEPTADTCRALIEAAARVFVRRGFHGATVREIAEEAGFTNPVLYYHFGSKEGLYQAVVRSSFERFQSLVDAADEGATDPLDRLRALATAWLRFGREDPVRLRLLYQEVFRPEGEDESLGFEAQRAWSRSRLDTALREGRRTGALPVRDVELAGRIFQALLGGLLVEQARDPRESAVDESLADVLVQVFLRGVGALEEPA